MQHKWQSLLRRHQLDQQGDPPLTRVHYALTHTTRTRR